MLTMENTEPEQVEHKGRGLWRIGSLIEMLKRDEAPAILAIHYESWEAFHEAIVQFAEWSQDSGNDWTEQGEEISKVCSALSDFLRSVLEGAEKLDGIPGFFGYELVEHEDGWIEVTEGVYHIWTLAGGQRLWLRYKDATWGAPVYHQVIENAPGAVLRLSLPHAIWKGQSFKLEAL